MYLDDLQSWVEENRSGLEARGVIVSLSERTRSDKSAQGVKLSASAGLGEVWVWVSGECDVFLGDATQSAEVEQRHHDLTSSEELLVVLDRFRDEFLAQPG